MDYFTFVRPTYIENWPADLCRMSISQADIPLTLDQARRLGSNIMELGESFGSIGGIQDIRELINEQIFKFPQGVVPRLGSRSPKDAWSWDTSRGLTTADKVIGVLTDCSERIFDDLHLAINNSYSPHLFLRQWISIPEWSEFRCFMKDRELVGISQYFYHDKYEEVKRNKDLFMWAIRDKFFGTFMRVSHLHSVIFDVFVRIREKGNRREAEVKLLEINPFFEMTDPCLFDWRKQDLDGSFRIVE